jgi:hypothetical protein
MNKYFAFIPNTQRDACSHGFCDRKVEYSLVVADFQNPEKPNIATHFYLNHLCLEHLFSYKEHYERLQYSNTTLKYFAKFYKDFLSISSDLTKFLVKQKINAYILSNKKNSQKR